MQLAAVSRLTFAKSKPSDVQLQDHAGVNSGGAPYERNGFTDYHLYGDVCGRQLICGTAQHSTWKKSPACRGRRGGRGGDGAGHWHGVLEQVENRAVLVHRCRQLGVGPRALLARHGHLEADRGEPGRTVSPGLLQAPRGGDHYLTGRGPRFTRCSGRSRPGPRPAGESACGIYRMYRIIQICLIKILGWPCPLCSAPGSPRPRGLIRGVFLPRQQ
jgi:hypothetical protein